MDRQIVIRTGAAADAEAVAALHAVSWRTAYEGIVPAEALGDGLSEERRELWAIRLTADYGEPANTPVLLIAETEGEEGPVGFAYLVPEPDGRVLLDNLHVRPGLTGAGIGGLLLRAALERTREAPLYLEVLCANTRAVAFYEREGGVRTDEREGVFPGGFTLPEYEYTWPPAATGGRTPSPAPHGPSAAQ
ncbi:GNAT family N-acetyltransferase [Kitasatospora atroaurantiaca]|uniref:Ribosomal protein S18 acetylase RimI-like enzyme n=1 Tax=Kitasatospora atroaurantiaca TaxID=285545 RepID=A0A561ER87_9ACTN|nr:GNAT family N-acetyltransferase [Kitasatospora atroaurantiaca]TWE18104.1 ribosomal protein S18 acetylase RimI-like enzyme [Kitasatospora atroaurantiaca]